MKIGLKRGATGALVERVHRVLAAIGLPVEREEAERREFGTSTLKAVQQLQRQRGLRERNEIDADTRAVLLEFEQNINIEIERGKSREKGPSGKPNDHDEHRGKVTGKLVNQDGAPLPKTRVSLFARSVRSEQRLRNAITSKEGQYRVVYRRPRALTLVVRAYDARNKVIAESATVFAAPAEVEINFSTAPGGVARNPSTYTTLTASVAAQLHDIPLGSLKENKDSHELQFLTNAVGVQFDEIAYLYIADLLGAQHKIQQATFFGIFYEGVPASLDTALTSLPDAGIDDTFVSQVLSGILAHSRKSLAQVLTTAVSANVLPASYAAAQDSELALLDALRSKNIGNTPYVRGKTSLNDLLAAGNVTQLVQTAFVQAYADNNGQLGPTWDVLRANKNLPAADLATLNTTLSLGELLTGNIPLIKDTLSRLSQKTLPSIQNLGLLDENDWIARITAVDPNGSSIPSVLPNDTTEQRIARFAKALAARFTSRFPTTAFAGGLSKAETSSFATKTELVSFITANPKLNFKSTSVDHFLANNQTTLSKEAISDLKTAQRLFRISPHYATVDAMKAAGHLSAQSVYFTGRDNFITAMTKPFGSASLAKMAYARAQMSYAASLVAFGRYNAAFNGINLPGMGLVIPDPQAITNLPDLQALFGSLDYFQCEDCQSVYSPAAYLVDLLQYLSWFSASGGGVSNARDALLLRRPDIQYIALDCNNTNTTLPYIDLVNEILEAAIAPPSPPVTVIDTTGTSDERRALPQQILLPAYELTRKAVFPLNLPFNLPFAEATALIGALGSTRAAVLALFAGNPVSASVAPSLAGASLQINPEMQAVINGSDSHKPWERWGLAQNPATDIDPKTGQPYVVIDPETRQPYSPTPADWVAALSKVPVLLNRTGLSLQQLYQLLEVTWVTQSGVTLQAGTTTVASVQVLSPNTDDMVFTGLTGNILDRVNRFLRLWTACGLHMWDLDWALEKPVGGVLDDNFLVFLANVIAVQKQINLPFQEVLSFWMPLETRDITNHLGDEDTVTPSTYSEVFRNPAVLVSSDAVFVPVNKTVVTGASNASPIAITTALPHGYQTGQQVSITGVLGNTAANGTFTITVKDTTTFTLNGSTGNGAWTSGGIATGILSGNTIIASPSGPPTPEQIAITASLALGAEDVSAILAFTGAANALSLDTLNVLLRFQRLSSALSLSISDLILWIQLTNGLTFGGAPADTLEFLRRLALLQSTGLAVVDLDYLLRNQSASQSSLTFTAAQATLLLQAIRDAMAKLPVPKPIPITGAPNTSPITITTAQANGLQTGAQVTISGVSGNTAANGTFIITVTSPTSFTLNGSTGNGPWTSGGTITPSTYTEDTIQTIFVAALATATSTSANVVTPILVKTGVLPLDSGTINKLLGETSGVDPMQFPGLISAFTSVAKATALFSALKPTEAEFAFVAQNASSFAWLDPGALPLVPTSTSPYQAFEALVRALKLDQRQFARSPKLFDILGQWLPPNPLPPNLATAIGGPIINITAASNASPIAVSTGSPHNLQSGAQVTISGVQGNTAANGTFTITIAGTSAFTLDGSSGNGAYTGGGTISQPSLAFALNASVNDVLAISTALNANAPGLTPATRPGSLADMAMLAAIAAALDVTVRYGISGPTLVKMTVVPATDDTADAAMGALQSQYAQSTWFGAIQPVEDSLRQGRRDALVAYMLGPGPVSPVPPFLTTDDIFDYYLIDPEMAPCALMTRLLQASLAIQQFVQQCFLNLFFSNVTVNMSDSRWSEWSWRQQYRLWQANREVFLYPENYLLPELRKDASSFFTDLENDLRQSNCDGNAAETAIQNYLRKLVGVSRLQVAAHYNETKTDGSTVLHVFAHTSGTPPTWYYRTRTSTTPDSGNWSAWQLLNLDIASQHLLPVIWDQRLFLVWPVFKPISEKQSSQQVPTGGGNTQPPPQKFWAVEFAMSELSAGQWQPKFTISNKMFFTETTYITSLDLLIDRAQLAFTFQASQDSAFNLQIAAYYNASAEELGAEALGMLFGLPGNIQPAGQIAAGTLPMPESPISVQQAANVLLPDASVVDLTAEPSYNLITTASFSNSLATPSGFFFSGQDLVFGTFSSQGAEFLTQTLGTSPLNVLCQTTAKGQPTNLELLGTIVNGRIVIPQQEPVFDSLDPFFVNDPTRTYLVQPSFYSLGSYPREFPNLKYVNQWNTRFTFQTFYHPYARTFLRELEIGGVPQLMARNLQVNPQSVRGWTPAFNFQSIYNPQPQPVTRPYPGETGAADPGETALDFAVGSSGAFSLYNWEVFYHIPMFIASLLVQNTQVQASQSQQFQDAITWLEYIFNPTDSSNEPTPQRFWQMAPLNAMNASDWINHEIQNLLTTLAADTQQGISDPATAVAIKQWMADPFDPHAIASLRISAYGKATVMKLFDVLIAYGDWYYSQYTAEKVSQAEQLFVFVDLMLGPKPQMLRLPDANPSGANTITYASLKNIDTFSNVLVNIENIIVAPEPPQSILQAVVNMPSLPQFPVAGTTLLFCIPPNAQLLAYWDKIAQRLYNIRHCLNLQGQPQPIPLYAPPMNPLALIEAQAAGASFSSATPQAPIYRFAVYLQKAIELTNDVRAYGALILSALEKQDAETLALLRANQELDIQTRILDVKTLAVTQAQDQITAMQNQKAVTQLRYNFYSTQSFLNAWEMAAIALQLQAMALSGMAISLDQSAALLHMLPSLSIGIAGFGGSPSVSASIGGEQYAASETSGAATDRALAGIANEAGAMAATLGGYQHRMDEWTLQANVAQAEMTQLDSQITTLQDALNIAQKELDIQNTNINNAQAVSTFLANKYTNAQLYNWMITQLTTVYAQAYQLAFSLALQAQNAYQYELGSQDTFIQFGYWDSQHKGLTAGESLLFDLRRMEAQYLAENSRELELTKHISLALTSPLALVMLRETGNCQIALNEILYEYDHPGQYFRRLRSVAVTIPCVTGPYTGVNATLTLTNAMVRIQPPGTPGTNYKLQDATAVPNDSSVRVSPSAAAGTQTIATSSGQSDIGLFEDNLRDERWRPFEGQGAICTMNLILDPRDNNFDISTMTDVILTVRYTARGGADQTAANIVRAALKPTTPRSILVSVRNTFPDNYYTFFNPDAAATQQVLTLPVTNAVFPFTNVAKGVADIQNITFFVALSVPASGNTIPASFSAPVTAVSLTPMPGQTAAGNSINGLTAAVALSSFLPAPQIFTLTVQSANIPAGLAVTVSGQTRLDPTKIEDILLVITYSIG